MASSIDQTDLQDRGNRLSPNREIEGHDGDNAVDDAVNDRPSNRTRLKQKQITRDRILKAAMELFFERGFNETRTDDIAKRAGVSHGSVFSHFKTKPKLLIALMAYAYGSALREPRTPPPPQSGLEGFKASVQTLWRQQTQFMALVQAYMAASWTWDKEDELEFAGVVDDLRGHWLKLLEQAQREGDVKPDLDLDMTITVFGVAYRETLRQSIYDPSKEAFLDEIIDFLFAATPKQNISHPDAR